MPRVLLSPDKFKGSATAIEVADALAEGIATTAPSWDVVRLPVADGGDGTVDAAVAAGWDRVLVSTTGPTGVPVASSYARRGSTAVVELASTVGLSQLPGGAPNALGAGTFGLGTVIRHALGDGAQTVVIGLGGSASTDGGAGMLRGLGVRILDARGREITGGGASLREAATLDLDAMTTAVTGVSFQLACDVDNPLLGPSGATAVYAPQKGADPDELRVLEQAMTRWAEVAGAAHADRPGAGAAGGTAFGAMAVLGATVRSGIDTVLELLEFRRRLVSADLVVTGEGSLDEQSLHGKAPVGVALAARNAGVPVIAVAGRTVLSAGQLREHGIYRSYSLADLEPDLGTSIRHATTLLRRVGATIATSLVPEGVS
ncbi:MULTISPECIES: glycerate kinase [Nocardiaceae]|uniref:Glycerate kinase n=1 Tax=Rhodococcoides corynebacterioides TaxID=53972 RepID=A0ABS2KSZ1_9NOCA|nr:MULTISPECIES: glycerate kinase [Rhodococcus]MBM7414987.1 glycerate kinase [Rhodococcus corynebacterioides]MBP1117449.1 glycerate kinase [Rhodococcus sp. PvP016]